MTETKHITSKESIWSFIKKQHENFEQSRKQYEEMIATAEDLVKNKKQYNVNLYNKSKRKLAFHDHLNEALKFKELNLQFENEYRELIQEFIWNNIRHIDDIETMHWDDVPKAFRTAIKEIDKHKEFQIVTYPFIDIFKYYLKYTTGAETDKIKSEQVMKAYEKLTKLKSFREIKVHVSESEEKLKVGGTEK